MTDEARINEALAGHRAQVEALAREFYLSWHGDGNARVVGAEDQEHSALLALRYANTFFDVCSKWWAE